jgi:type II restriction enzyme
MASKKNVVYTGKGQAERLVQQHEKSGGVEGIFGAEAKSHDAKISAVSEDLLERLKTDIPHLEFRIRTVLTKKEINDKLKSVDERLGEVLFVEKASIQPDGGFIEVQDKNKAWHVILVSESKHQGNDIEKIKAGIKQGKNKNQDLMVAGNAIERVHKNILEVRNFMIDEDHFPYIVFLQGTNFAIKTHYIKTPDGRDVEISHKAGGLNRIDRVTASNYGMKINTNHCKNLKINNHKIQSASLYFQCMPWTFDSMLRTMSEVVQSSLETLSSSGIINLNTK